LEPPTLRGEQILTPGAAYAFFVSTGVVALAEIGDKTQLLAIVLAAKFRRPLPIIAGIFFATMANHAAAGLLGSWVSLTLSPQTLRWVLGLSFIGMAFWTLVPDQLDKTASRLETWGVFSTTLVAFFLAEIGDKTQIATVALAAKYQQLLAVVAGTTLGMLLANVPAVYLGDRAASALPLRWVRLAAAAVFLAVGIATLAGAGARLGLPAG
jgi:Ca2+/H+ antiporter, TMEM165/GDT1 family